MTQAKNRPTKLYLVWESDLESPDGGYFNQYETLHDAVQSTGGLVEVFIASIKRLGTFRMSTNAVRVKIRKKKAVKP